MNILRRAVLDIQNSGIGEYIYVDIPMPWMPLEGDPSYLGIQIPSNDYIYETTLVAMSFARILTHDTSMPTSLHAWSPL